MAEVLNHDVAGMCRRINSFIIEMQKSVSGGVSDMNEFDQARLQKYLDSVRAYRNWVVDQPHLDLPETHPRTIEIGPDPESPDVENEAVRDVVYLMELCRDELVNSQSARIPAGFIIFDDARAMSLVEKCQRFLDDYIKLVQPIDMPESSPSQPLTGAGATGI